MAAMSVSDATTSTKGIVQIGSGLGVTAGVVSANVATTSTPGILQVTNGSGLTLTTGTLSFTVPTYADATTSTKGILQVTNGNGLTLTSGTLSFTPSYPDATTSTKGVVQIGTGLSVTSGTVSANVATTSTQGILQVTATNGLVLTTGTLSFDPSTLPVATSSVFGVVKTGTGITNTSGTITVPVATSSTTGLVSVPSANGLSVNGSGDVAIGVATSSVFGVVKVGTSMQISSGVLNVASTYVSTSNANTFTAAQVVALSNLIDASTVDVNLSLGNVFFLSIGGNRALGTPSNPVVGGQYMFVIRQQSSGTSTLTWPSSFKFRTGQSSALSSGIPFAYDVITATYVSSGVYLCDIVKGFV
jgi:hypothetical protein